MTGKKNLAAHILASAFCLSIVFHLLYIGTNTGAYIASSDTVAAQSHIYPSPKSQKISITKVAEAAEKPKNDFCLNAPVLFYHHIEPYEIAKAAWHEQFTVDSAIFDAQMAYLSQKGYHSITAEELALAVLSGSPLPQKAIVLTFDDGYADFYKYAYPILNKYGMKGNLMISTGLLENPNYLTWAQLKEMQTSGNIFAYNHTWSHASLTKSSREKVEYEVQTAKKQLEDNLGKPQKIFTYPYGNYDSQSESYLAKSGFIAAFSTNPGTLQCKSYAMSLHRTRIGNSPLSTYGL